MHYQHIGYGLMGCCRVAELGHRSGVPWCDLSGECGDWNAVHPRFRRWEARGSGCCSGNGSSTATMRKARQCSSIQPSCVPISTSLAR